MKASLHRFHGGLVLDGHKAESLSAPLRDAGLPPRLYLPLRQHIGDVNQPLVEVGNRVRKGEIVAASASLICAPVHAPTSGVVRAIGPHPAAHPSGQPDSCIVLDVDGEDEPAPAGPVDTDELEPAEMIQRICRAGIVGLGGAAFPTSPKLSRARAHRVETLIINGVECEPYITCDDILMRNFADEVLRGIGYLQQILAPDSTLIGIEDNKPEAIAAMSGALATRPLAQTQIVPVPTIYPAGGEKQLIQILTGREVPHGQLAFDIGLLCQNVGTCVAIARAFERGEPLLSRIVTVSGDNLAAPANFEVRLGTPVAHLIELAGGYVDPRNAHLVMGGPMMGFSLASDAVPIVKASNCILAMRAETIPRAVGPHDECIRCGKCTEVCPASLLPQQLYWHARARNFERTREYHLFDCIECGCCSAVCPSRIPLVQYYRAAKSEIRAAERAQYRSDRARVRFEFREKRLALKKQQEEERRRQKREALERRRAGDDPAAAARDPVQAALERVKARKQRATQDEAS